MHNLIKSQIQNLNNFNFHYILIILIKFHLMRNNCLNSFISKMRKLEKKSSLRPIITIITEMVNHLGKAERKDNEK